MSIHRRDPTQAARQGRIHLSIVNIERKKERKKERKRERKEGNGRKKTALKIRQLARKLL
jgi:hypothetical protein